MIIAIHNYHMNIMIVIMGIVVLITMKIITRARAGARGRCQKLTLTGWWREGDTWLMNLGVMVIIRDMMIISLTDFSDHTYNHKYNHIAACPTTPATSTSAARPVVQKTATVQRMCLMIIQVLAADHLDDHRYIDNAKTRSGGCRQVCGTGGRRRDTEGTCLHPWSCSSTYQIKYMLKIFISKFQVLFTISDFGPI